MFHKEGYKILVSSLVGLIIINLLSNLLIDKQWIVTAIFLATFVMFILIAQFF